MDLPAGLDIWLLPALLGLGLAAATGLKTFLPLLMLAAAAKFEMFGIDLNDKMDWLASWPAIATLGVATAVELAADKIPVVDHALHAGAAFIRPLAAALAAFAVFSHADPMVGAIAGLIIGAPTALAFNAAQGGTRLASTATTAGVGNPAVSLIEDVLAFGTVLLAFVAPLLVPVVLIVLLVAIFWVLAKVKRKLTGPAPKRRPV